MVASQHRMRQKHAMQCFGNRQEDNAPCRLPARVALIRAEFQLNWPRVSAYRTTPTGLNLFAQGWRPKADYPGSAQKRLLTCAARWARIRAAHVSKRFAFCHPQTSVAWLTETLYSSGANRVIFGRFPGMLRCGCARSFAKQREDALVDVDLPRIRRLMEDVMRLASGRIRTTVAAWAAISCALLSSVFLNSVVISGGSLEAAPPATRGAATPSVGSPSVASPNGGSAVNTGPLRALPPPQSSAASSTAKSAAQEMQWIWTPAYANNLSQKSPAGTCYFRRSFEMAQPEAGEVQITADESYELYVNGRKVGEGQNWHVMDVHDITRYLGRRATIRSPCWPRRPKRARGNGRPVLVKSAGDT